ILDELKAAQWIMPVPIKASRDDDQIRMKISDARQNLRFDRLAKSRAVVAGRQRRIDDIAMLAAFIAGARAWKQRHLMTRSIKDGRVRPKNFLGPVSMVHVEI